MWIMSDSGFFSIVQHRDDANLMLVRSRARKDLEALLAMWTIVASSVELETIQHTPAADYPYRVTVPKKYVVRLLTELVWKVDYPNFKNAVAEKQGLARAAVYHAVWSVMHQTTDKDAHGKFLVDEPIPYMPILPRNR